MQTRLLLVLSLLLVPAIRAQTAAPENQAAAKKDSAALETDEVLELSPFQVTSDNFNGYYASQTLAGSRLKTNINEVASSIQILTPEFLEDIGANNSTQYLLYTTSTETSGINGNFSDSSQSDAATSPSDESSRVNPQGSQRVRGITGADLTRNYFVSLIPSDRFNTEAVEINRGANAILFGLGSPAGIINTQIAGAKFKNSREVKITADDQGSLRSEATFNQVVVPGKLAVRLSALKDDTKFYQRPAYENDHRLYGAFTLRPWKNGSFRGFVEMGDRDANRPNTVPPASTISSWIANQPLMVERMRAILSTAGSSLTVPSDYPLIYSPVAQSWRTGAQTSTAYLSSGSISNDIKLQILRNDVIWHNNSVANPRLIFHPNMSKQIAAVYLPGAMSPGGAVGNSGAIETNISPAITTAQQPLPLLGNPLNPDGVGSAPGYNYFAPEQPWRTTPVLIPQSLTNLDTFDFTRNSLAGHAPFQNDKWSQANLVFEQTTADQNLGIELAYDKQHYRRESYVPFQGYTGVFVDLMQEYLGQPNPNLGRPFVAERTGLNKLDDSRESFRATVFARFDPERRWNGSSIARWLGKHTFTGFYSTYDQVSESMSMGQYYKNSTAGFTLSPSSTLLSLKVNNIVYVGDSILGVTDESQVHLTPLDNQQLWNPGQTINLHTYNTTLRAYEDVTLQTAAELESASRDTQSVDTLAATWNASFFSNNLIGLFGLRQDTELAERRVAINGADQFAVYSSLDDPNNTLSRLDSKFLTRSWSVVGKLPESWVRLPFGGKLSAYYGNSENSGIGITANDIFGNQLTPPSGSTKEMGVMVSLFDQKLALRINRYRTQVANSPSSSSKYSVFVGQGVLKTMEGLLEAEAYGNQGAATPNYAIAMNALQNLKAIVPESTLARANLLAPVNSNGDYARRDIANIGDTEDVDGTGTEYEVIWNPNKSWRFALNVANQKTTLKNYSPRLGALIALVEPYFGPNGTLAPLKYFNDKNMSPPSYISEAAPAPGSTTTTVAQWLEANVYSPYRTQKLQEGRGSTEQRAWRVNLVGNYSFRSGMLKGMSLGSAVRWQDGAVIGYSTTVDPDGTIVADIDNPHVAPSITNIDAWIRYARRLWRNKVDWTIELRVQNLNHSAQDLIPVRANLTTDYSVAQYRVGPPRVISVSNTFKF